MAFWFCVEFAASVEEASEARRLASDLGLGSCRVGAPVDGWVLVVWGLWTVPVAVLAVGGALVGRVMMAGEVTVVASLVVASLVAAVWTSLVGAVGAGAVTGWSCAVTSWAGVVTGWVGIWVEVPAWALTGLFI